MVTKYILYLEYVSISLLILTLANPVFAEEIDNSTNSFISDKFKFKIDYPSTWKVIITNNPNYDSVVTFQDPKVNSPPEIEVFVRELFNESDPLSSMEKKFHNLELFGMVKNLESNHIQNNLFQIYNVTFVTKSHYDLDQYKTQQFFFEFGGNLFQISFKASLNSYDKYYPVFLKTINTLELQR